MDFLISENKKHSVVDINNGLRVINIEDVNESDLNEVCAKLEENGFVKKETLEKPFHIYTSYMKDEMGVFLNYFCNLSEINIAVEENCRYFSYTDNAKSITVSPQITQIYLEDFGLSYVIRLSDGRFIVIDGGWDFKPDAKRLFDVLKAGCVTEKPVVAAWIMTHAHMDHYRCFNVIAKLYSNELVVEKVLLNFPDEKKFIQEKFTNRRPCIKDDEYVFENSSDYAHLTTMYKNIELFNAEVYVPHTGQVYNISDAKIEFLSTIDDTYYFSNDENSASLVFKMELGGQTILWTGDASFSDSRLSAKFGDYIKADILQVPHHGFGSGSFEEQIVCYELISPSVCMLPVADYEAYKFFCPYREGTRYLLEKAGIDELITGNDQRTITLPYHAPVYAKKVLETKISEGLKSSGSKTWIFTGLNTSVKGDFVFGFTNLTAVDINVTAELYFDNAEKNMGNIKICVPACTYVEINITDKNSVDLNPMFFSWNYFDVKKLPKKADFAVRFSSNEAVVISHKKHACAYHS